MSAEKEPCPLCGQRVWNTKLPDHLSECPGESRDGQPTLDEFGGAA